jgi:hypothetical protein
MTALSTAPLGLEFVRVEELHYGKLAVTPTGHVPMGEGYSTTYRTSGFLHPDRVLPTRLLDGAFLQPDHIEEPFRRTGALFFRLVDETLVAMRARYRPEAGEGQPGRTYLQASILQIETVDGYAGVPPAFIPWANGVLKVVPDLITERAVERIGVDPHDEVFDCALLLSRNDLDAFDSRRRLRLAAIIQAMREATPIIVGDDSFDDPSNRLSAFLEDIRLALTLMFQTCHAVSRNFQIACGLSADVVGSSLQLSSVARSTPQLVMRWDDVVRMISPTTRSLSGTSGARAGQSSFGTGAPLERLPGQPSRGTFGQRATALASHQTPSTSQTPPLVGNSEPVVNAPVSESADEGPVEGRSGVVSNSDVPFYGNQSAQGHSDRGEATAARTVHAARAANLPEKVKLDEFNSKFVEAANEPTATTTSLEMFKFAADLATQAALKNWNPFESSGFPGYANTLLGLLMGVWGRGDLLDHYTFVEFFCIWPYLNLMDADGKAKWGELLTKRMDIRINKLGVLTSKELGLLAANERSYDMEQFSEDARKIVHAASNYRVYMKLCLEEPHNLLDRTGDVGDALKKLHARYEKAKAKSRENIGFCASEFEADVSSVFSLPSRERLMEQSNDLLVKEADAARDLLVRIQSARANTKSGSQ